MSALTITGPWEWDSEYRCKFAPTSDPRVVAVIERDSEPSAPDGDVYAPAYRATPTYAWSPTRPTLAAGYDAPDALDILAAFQRADGRLGENRGWTPETVDRYLRIFHGAAVRVIPTRRYRNDEPIVVLDTPAWREHVGIEGGPDKSHLDGDISELTNWLDGDVFGIGYGVYVERVIDTGGSLDIEDYEITIECWGFYGEDYAIESAAAFEYGAPDLPTMLDLSLAGAQ